MSDTPWNQVCRFVAKQFAPNPMDCHEETRREAEVEQIQLTPLVLDTHNGAEIDECQCIQCSEMPKFLHEKPYFELWLKSDTDTQMNGDDGGISASDGATDGSDMKRGKQPLSGSKPVAAIFIHAGAGWHSFENERIHLKACSEAAHAGMKILRAGGSAVQAVEAAIVVLEDNEITNCGYGSNLSIDGTVECDASIVNHLGSGGACGAVPEVKHPISLARHILDGCYHKLSLNRVPPNLLVGRYATEYAENNGIETVKNEVLIAKNAGLRYRKWYQDLLYAEAAQNDSSTASASPEPPAPGMTTNGLSDNIASRDHTNAILTGTWNEGQPDSPAASSPMPSPEKSALPRTSIGAAASEAARPMVERSPLSLLGSSIAKPKGVVLTRSPSPIEVSPKRKRMRIRVRSGDQNEMIPEPNNHQPSKLSSLSPHDGTTKRGSDDGTNEPHAASSTTYHGSIGGFVEDHITDTVGAIAIDNLGNIAAGSSSGGIGMKHRGRIGPAALIGVGSAVIPAYRWDDDSVTVAAVTSGTGEHITTTMAAQKCAERIYHEQVRWTDRELRAESNEAEILKAFMEEDFLQHPSVVNSVTVPALGVMAVKKMDTGYYLYFAHNTDSFALAAMSSRDREPGCVMSRTDRKSGQTMCQGAKKIHLPFQRAS